MYPIYSGVRHTFYTLKIGSKIDCDVYTSNAKRECIILLIKILRKCGLVWLKGFIGPISGATYTQVYAVLKL